MSRSTSLEPFAIMSPNSFVSNGKPFDEKRKVIYLCFLACHHRDCLARAGPGGKASVNPTRQDFAEEALLARQKFRNQCCAVIA